MRDELSGGRRRAPLRKGVAMRVSMHRRLIPVVIVIAMLATFIPVVPAMAVTPVPTTIYVDAVNGSDTTGDGTASNPYMSITAGLDGADYGDTIDIAPGTYSTSETGETFPLPISPSKITLQGSDPYECIIDAEWEAAIIWLMDGSEFAMSGLTLTHGFNMDGGALTASYSTVNATDCIFTQNGAARGGAIFVGGSTVTLAGCELTENGQSATPIPPAEVAPEPSPECLEGGAIYAIECALAISDCSIGLNSATDAGGGVLAAGSTVTAEDSVFYANNNLADVALGATTDLLEGGIVPAGSPLPGLGGAFLAASTDLNVVNCGFWENSAFIGSSVIGLDSDVSVEGSWFEGDMTMAGVVANVGGFLADTSTSVRAELAPTESLVESYLSVEGSTFQGNEGSPIAMQTVDGIVRNCLVTDNSSPMATLLFLASDADVVNTTLANNVSGDVPISATPIVPQTTIDPLPEVRVTNSIVWDENEDEVSVEGATVTYSDLRYLDLIVPNSVDETVISEDPEFVDPEFWDYSLAGGSPCIDTGVDFELAPDVDIDGTGRPIDGNGDGTAEWDMGAYELGGITDGRIEGADRFETAVEISKDHFASADTAILATGRVFADGLSASGLAGAYNAPILLTEPNVLPAVVAQELVRLGVSHVIICGDERAVSAGVEGAVASLGDIEVERIGGADRYETAAMLADEIAVVTDSDPALVFVARGDTFPDALAVSPVAWSMAAPVLLVRPDELPRYAVDYFLGIVSNTKTRTVIVGGQAAVSSGVEGGLVTLGIDPEDRIAGADRYQTACAVAVWADDMGFADFGVTGVATGEDFADALSGGPGIGASGGVLLLNPKRTANPTVCDTISDYAGDISALQIFGSGAAITDEVAEILNDCRLP